MLQSKKSIELIMKEGIRRMNNDKDFNIRDVFYNATKGDLTRTARIVIYDDEDPEIIYYDTILGFENDQIVEIQNNVKPTVTYKFNTSTFLYLVSQTYEFRQLFFLGKFKVEGESFLRDYIVWSRFWKKYHDVLKLNFYEKIFIRPQEGKL